MGTGTGVQEDEKELADTLLQIIKMLMHLGDDERQRILRSLYVYFPKAKPAGDERG